MENVHFRLAVDLPLLVGVVALFLGFNEWWARKSELQVNLVDRLPAARFRIILFFGLLAVFCWYLNFAFWFLIVLVGAVGVAISVALGGGGEGIGLLATAYMIREWAFGFPQLRLQPPDYSAAPKADGETCELIGARGKTLSPLRPCGDAEIDGKSGARDVE